ncbi:MAG: hypothetical protein AABY22_27645 [Nanoarchaeota archaeon]
MENYFDITKYGSITIIEDFSKLEHFSIIDEFIYLDSHDDFFTNLKCKLMIKQKFYQDKVKKPNITLLNSSNFGKIQIRFNQSEETKITSLDVAIDYFNKKIKEIWDVKFEYNTKTNISNTRLIDSYSDEELLKIVFDRTMKRVGEYRIEPPITNNIIELRKELDLAA